MVPLDADVTFLSEHVAEAECLRFFSAAGHLIVLADGAVIDMAPWDDNGQPKSRAALSAAISRWLDRNPHHPERSPGRVIDLHTRRRIA